MAEGGVQLARSVGERHALRVSGLYNLRYPLDWPLGKFRKHHCCRLRSRTVCVPALSHSGAQFPVLLDRRGYAIGVTLVKPSWISSLRIGPEVIVSVGRE